MIPESRIENVRGSVFQYLKDNYTETEIAFSRTNFDEEEQDEWIAPTLLVAGRDFKRQVDNGHLGARLAMLLNISIIAKKAFIDGESTAGRAYRPERIRDILADLFKEGQNIQVVDNVGGTGNLGVVQVFDIETDQDLGLDADRGVYNYNFTPRLFYLLEM